MQEILGIDKALQSLQVELVNNALKLSKIEEQKKKDSKKLRKKLKMILPLLKSKGSHTEMNKKT